MTDIHVYFENVWTHNVLKPQVKNELHIVPNNITKFNIIMWEKILYDLLVYSRYEKLNWYFMVSKVEHWKC